MCKWFLCLGASLLSLLVGCQPGGGGNASVSPKELRDVPAARLSFSVETDLAEELLPPEAKEADAPKKNGAIERDFETRRPDEELLRTVVSPDGQRALAVYATRETEGGDFRMDLYSAEGVFVRNILPANMTATFADTVAWAPDGQKFAFVALRNPAAEATPDPGLETTAPPENPDPGALPVPTVAPVIAPAPVFSTEQVYVADRDGMSLRPLTTRDGLIYFELAWAPDSQHVAALACREQEWGARRRKNELPAGRPRLVSLDGQERLLDDRLTDARPAWSPDSSKVAAAFDKTLAIYDAAGAEPTGANLPLDEPLWSASLDYDARHVKGAANTAAAQAPGGAPPPMGSVHVNSFVPVSRLVWSEPETLYVQTAYIRLYENAPVVNYVRWHVVHLYRPATKVGG